MNPFPKISFRCRPSSRWARGLWQGVVVAALCGALPCGLRAETFDNVTVNYNLSVGGNLSVNGNFTSGNFAADLFTSGNLQVGGQEGWSGYEYYDGAQFEVTATPADGAVTNVTMGGAFITNWTWTESNVANVSGNFATAMSLDPLGVLTVYNGTAGSIVINPGNQTIAFSGGLVINGNASTLGLTNITFIFGDNGFTAANGAIATGNRSAALGGNASATGNLSVALANGNANGYQSLAAAFGVANGTGSVALGAGTATGNWSLAFGNNSLANATGAMALGDSVTADAVNAMALGTNVTASTWSSFTVGHFNAEITGNTTSWVATDPAFIVGIGQNSSATANGLVVLNNGVATISDAPGNTILLDPGNQKITFSDGLVINDPGGAMVVTGTISGNIVLDPDNQRIVFSNGLTIAKNSTTLVLGLGSSGLAAGNNAVANASGAVALGTNVTTNAWDSVTVGHFNSVITASSNTTYDSRDPAFIVGIGQNATTGAANGLVILNNGIIYSGTGNYSNLDGNTGLLQGNGTRMMWVPQNSALLAGTPANATIWNYSNLGIGIAAIGYNASAAGNGSVAIGYNVSTHVTSGNQDGSVALGKNSTAIGADAVAIGGGVTVDLSANGYGDPFGAVAIGGSLYTSGFSSVVMGYGSGVYTDVGIAMGYNVFVGGYYGGNISPAHGSSAIGYGSVAYGNSSVAYGDGDTASGTGAVAIGYLNLPLGNGAVAIGSTNAATGNNTVALGGNNTATDDGTVVLGSNLTVTTDHALVAGQWAGVSNGTGNFTISGNGPTSPLFVLGNGTSAGNLSTAFTVLKNGDTTVRGNLTLGGNIAGNATVVGNLTISGNLIYTAAFGDISMGAYGY